MCQKHGQKPPKIIIEDLHLINKTTVLTAVMGK